MKINVYVLTKDTEDKFEEVFLSYEKLKEYVTDELGYYEGDFPMPQDLVCNPVVTRKLHHCLGSEAGVAEWQKFNFRERTFNVK